MIHQGAFRAASKNNGFGNSPNLHASRLNIWLSIEITSLATRQTHRHLGFFTFGLCLGDLPMVCDLLTCLLFMIR